MPLIDRLMERWAMFQRRTELCAWCHRLQRDPSIPEGRYCSEECATKDGDFQAFGM